MLERLIIKDLDKWKKSGGKKAFILDGARQIGKTYILDWYCKENFTSYLYINLLKEKKNFELLKSADSLSDYFSYFNLISKSTLIPGESVIFIDETQELPEIITQLKFFVIDGRYKFIVAGSLLGLQLFGIRSIPVGYAEMHTLYPMNFREFLLASNVSKEIIFEAETCLSNLTELPKYIFQYFSMLFDKYLLIGGMPEAVSEYIQREDYATVFDIQETIIETYLNDFSRYKDKTKKIEMKDLYLNIPDQLLKEYKRFNLSEIMENSRYSIIENSISWLVEAGCVHKVNLINDLSGGLIKTNKENFKLYINDVGILSTLFGEGFRHSLITKTKGVNYGAIYENFVCQELKIDSHSIFYYKTKKHGEVEFVYFDKRISSIVPIEVKSGSDYKHHISLDYLINTYHNLDKAYVLANTNIKVEGKIVYLPIWSIGLFPHFDFSKLPKIGIPKLEDFLDN